MIEGGREQVGRASPSDERAADTASAVDGQTADVRVDLMAAHRALHNLRVYSAQP